MASQNDTTVEPSDAIEERHAKKTEVEIVPGSMQTASTIGKLVPTSISHAQKQPEASPTIVVATASSTAASSSSTIINFEPLRVAIRKASDEEGRALVIRLEPPPNWRQKSGYTKKEKWGKYLEEAIIARVVVRAGTNSGAWLKICEVNYLPLHAAIWRRCDGSGKARMSRVLENGMQTDWRTRSGFEGALEDYIEFAIHAKAVVRGGPEPWLKIYTGLSLE
ncbi:hypothetical protein FRC17_010218 [Serendipita sp. 399]|nr:hypothetical protein FRC17_010218 [Serendipita sp. 399]